MTDFERKENEMTCETDCLLISFILGCVVATIFWLVWAYRAMGGR